ncbi:MAG TPA: DMT family transporter [Micromonosporaceae bacterium]|nr:DMT family transporter [Micromonosporaceae bacterium]
MRNDRRNGVLAITAVGVTLFLWASAFVAIRGVGRQMSPGPIALGRLVVGSLVLGIGLAFRSRSGRGQPGVWRSRAVWVRLVTVGVLWFGVYNVALNAAERRIDAGTAAMLVNIGPILIAVLAAVTLHEGFPRPLVLGGLTAFAGAAVIGLSTSHTAGADVWGVVLCVVAAAAYAISVVTQKPLLERLSALQVTWVACTIGMVVCLPYAGQLVHEARRADASTLWWVVYLGAMPTALAFTTWAYALARTSAGRLGMTTYLVPFIAVGLGWLFLGETPAALAYVGGVLCLAGVAISRRRSAGSRSAGSGQVEAEPQGAAGGDEAGGDAHRPEPEELPASSGR